MKEAGAEEFKISGVREFKSSGFMRPRAQESGVQRSVSVVEEYIDGECGVQGQVLVNKVFQEHRRAESQEFRNRE